MERTARFILRVIKHFFGQNNGLLLSGAVAYNTLLSVIPLCALILIIASHFIEERQLLVTISSELAMLVPGQAQALTEALAAFMSEREVIGVIGILVLLFFSSIAFRTLENAMAVIFGPSPNKPKRSFWMSALLPYIFIVVMGIGVMVLTTMTAIIDALPEEAFRLPLVHTEISLDRASAIILHIFGVIGLTLLFTAIYKVMPATTIQFRRALIGGATATLLWEIVRYFLMWYFTSISLVNVIYGSLATVIIVLLTMEVAAVIVLLGAQVIAEVERNDHAGVPWHEELQEGIRKKIALAREAQIAPLLDDEVASNSEL